LYQEYFQGAINRSIMTTLGPRIEKSPFYTSSPFEPIEGPPTSLDEIDLTDHKLYTHGDFHAALRLLREQAPIFWHTKGAPSPLTISRSGR
jgi:hypothetical protein